MTSPSMVHRSGDTLVVRSVVSGNQLYIDDNDAEPNSEDASDIDYDDFQDADDNKNLPECKIRRNYSCSNCNYFTQNPRHFLYHLRDVHKEKVKIYECPNCLYASKHFQKLLRHMKMVHGSSDGAELHEPTNRNKERRKRKRYAAAAVEEQQQPAEELEAAEDVHMEEDETGRSAEDASSKATADLKCSLCSFSTRHQGQLTRHEKQEHIKTKFFRCTKCSYVTHIKARFTKHVKYHSMPMIKCDLCDFRTPYKWNLDRHYKNHNGHGAFRCSACNFTADIKQSLTVHEMNHHVPPVGQAAGLGVGRRRNKVGASDTTAAEEAAAAATAEANDQQHQLLTLTHKTQAPPTPPNFVQVSVPQTETVTEPPKRKGPRIKISLKKFKTTHTQEQNERHNFDTDFIHPDDIIHHPNGNIYIKTKCKLCNYKTAWDSEMAKHERKVHNIVRDNIQPTNIVTKKPARPIPNLIPIQSQSTAAPTPLLKIPVVQNRVPGHGQNLSKADEYNMMDNVMTVKDMNDICAKSANSSSLRDFASLFDVEGVFSEQEKTEMNSGKSSVQHAVTSDGNDVPQTDKHSPESNSFKKKNASFFDKLKEKLMTDAGESSSLTCKWCGHESKCLSELAGHQKTCGKETASINNMAPAAHNTSSTRCQHCRQRCKSSIDLHNHLQICPEANKEKTFEYKCEKPDITIKLEDDSSIHEDSLQPHPMENVVFVWNDIPPTEEEQMDERHEDNSMDLSIRVQSPESENSYMEAEQVTEHTPSPSKLPTHGNDLDLVGEGRRVFKCPHCSFWATTASRFHVHIVGHLNKKPFECSLCSYRSNWRWDITKHIRLKSVRDPAHEMARVLMTDETGRRNYSKYNKYLTQMKTENSNETHSHGRRTKSNFESHGKVSPSHDKTMQLPTLVRAPTLSDFQPTRNVPLRPPPPLKAANGTYFQHFDEQKKRTASESKKTLFKCKKCNFRDASRENILLHVKGHYRQEQSHGTDTETDEASVLRGQAPFRCGHCHQVSNWKHVIQRHCRLKHSGDVRVVIGGKNGSSDKIEVEDQTDEPDHLDVIQSGSFKCSQCPYSINSQPEFENHLEMHVQKPDSAMKCYFCPFYVAQKFELFDHLKLHGVSNPEDYVNRAMQGRSLSSPISQEGFSFKRYKCVACPYVSNSKSQFLYHKQFHRPRGAPFKCEFCSYNVSRRHLLHQHLRVHGVAIPPQKNSYKSGSDRESDAMDEDFGIDEFEEVMSPPASNISFAISFDTQTFPDVPLVWVSKEGKFVKMFKCRFCPHVNMRKINIQEHEKMHSIREKNPSQKNGEEHHCSECSYICNNAGVLSSHSKVHQGFYGTIHCLVDSNKTDTEQISELTRLLNKPVKEDITSIQPDVTTVENGDQDDSNEYSERVLFFCEHCPARFLHEKDFHIHNRFHGIRLFYRCDYCSYAARQRPHLLSHNKVHTDEYQERTKELQKEYSTSKDHLPPRTAVIIDGPGVTNGPVWVVISGGDKATEVDESDEVSVPKVSNKNFGCVKCPARFFKKELLQYHMTLHGCNNPYKCKYCDYAARTSSNLQKHAKIHENTVEIISLPTPQKHSSLSTVPLSGTDLFQQRAEAQKHQNAQNESLLATPQHVDPQFGTLMHGNPKFVYPTYLKNGRMKEKRYKCHLCPSAFEKREQYKVHLSLHGSKQRYKCENCDYSVKYYANYVQHTRKHQVNAEVARKGEIEDCDEDEEMKDNSSGDGQTTPPFCKLAIKTLNSSSKRGPLKLSVADRQTLMILQQRRVSNASSTKEASTEEKKLFWCPHCPYTNYRRDAVDNHVNRHIIVSGVRNNYTCEHCDYTVPQSHFLREHTKVHFTAQKSHQPEGFMVCDNLQLCSTKSNCKEQEEESSTKESSCVIFQDCGNVIEQEKLRFKPFLDLELIDNVNNNDIDKVYINPENGEVIENCAVSVKSDTKEKKSF